MKLLPYFAIPAVLAIGAIWWLAFGKDLHYFNREVSQEARRAEIVKAEPLPKAPLKIVIKQPRDSRLVVDRAEIDGGKVWLYAHNASGGRIEYGRIEWRLISESGITLKSGGGYINLSWNGPETLEPGERMELSASVDIDPRASAFEVIVN